jgi:hypothetical protein
MPQRNTTINMQICQVIWQIKSNQWQFLFFNGKDSNFIRSSSEGCKEHHGETPSLLIPLQTIDIPVIITLSGSGRAERKDMRNATSHVVRQSHFHSIIVARSSKTLIKTRHQGQGVEEWDRGANQLDPITTGNNC